MDTMAYKIVSWDQGHPGIHKELEATMTQSQNVTKYSHIIDQILNSELNSFASGVSYFKYILRNL